MLRSFLQLFAENAYLVGICALVGLVSGIIAIIDSTKKHITKRVDMPVWGVLLLICVSLVIGALLNKETPFESSFDELEEVRGKEFGVQTIVVDHKRFIGCSFDGTQLILRGEGKGSFVRCSFANERIKFEGAAYHTLVYLTDMYKVPEMKPMVEYTLMKIKTGQKDFDTFRNPLFFQKSLSFRQNPSAERVYQIR